MSDITTEIDNYIESYVHEVSRFVPKEQRSEVFEDLYAAIYEEVDGRAEAQGRLPDAEDVEQVLKRFGHPLLAAGKYQAPRYLIGPELFPVFVRTLTSVFVGVSVVLVAVCLLLGSTQQWQIHPWSLFWSGFEIMLWIMLAVFGVFIALEYAGEKLNLYGDWAPEKMGRNTIATIDRQDLVTNIVGEGFFLLWWNDVIQFAQFIPDETASLTLAPIWSDYFFLFNLLFGASFVLHVWVLALGLWRRWALVSEIVLSSALVGLAIVLLGSGDLILIEGKLSEHAPDKLNDAVQLGVRSLVGVITAITIWDIYRNFQIWRGVVR